MDQPKIDLTRREKYFSDLPYIYRPSGYGTFQGHLRDSTGIGGVKDTKTRETRHDAVPLPEDYITLLAEYAKNSPSAKQARKRMLDRQKAVKADRIPAEARQAMIERQRKKT